jgi:predicted oxidoreductase (fatty acid repression mutant protein)
MHSQFDNQVKRKVILLKKKGPSKWKKETDINIKHISYEEFLEKQKAKDRADIGTKSSTLILFHEPKDNNTDQTEPTPKTAPQTASPPDMQPDVQGE